ncbi:protein Shroom3 [Pristis pectinata]|uniref:protein Shroom3 n=1 Tax=Pristis pectinata TaxID=685728 RepID=UPI00223D00BE|nr:protein Shroom3 [Pristis pectinata]XP_051870868.1 protein Shroom3 [Pristis pectinata]
MDRLDQTGAANSASRFSPNRQTGYINQLGHHNGKEDSGYGSFSPTFSAAENVSLLHCSHRPWQTGKVFYQGPDSDTQRWTGTKPTSVVCDAGAMGNEERPVFLSMENYNNNGHGREYNWSKPPPPPTRHDSFLVIRQHDGFGCYHTRDGSNPQDVSQRSSVESKMLGMTLENNCQSKETSSLPQTPFLNASLKNTGFVPEKHSQTVEGAGNFTPKRIEKAPPNNITNSSLSLAHHNSGIAFDCVESQKQIHCLPLASGQKPVLVSPRHPELPSPVMCGRVNARSQEISPHFYVTTTYSQTLMGESRPAKGFPGSSQSMCPEDKEGRNPEVNYKFNVVRGCKNRQRSLSEASARHLLHQPLGLDNSAHNCQIFCGSNEYSRIPKTHLPVTESVQVRKQCSQRKMRNSTGSVGHQLVPCPEARNNCDVFENLLKPANETSSPGAITAENTPMLHRLAFEATNVGRSSPTSPKQKFHLSGGQKDMHGQNGGSQGLCRALENKMTQLQKCKSSSRLLNESIDLSQLNEEAPDTSGSSINSSKTAYRNQVKHAQSKVLKETSFKRRDLQLSWPNRAKQKPIGRPSITHFQTDSLSDPSRIPDDPAATSPPSQGLHENQRVKPLDPQHKATRTGSRKRLTLLEKKMYSSEPEKINQLGVVCSPRKWGQAETFKFPDMQGNSSLVTSRRQLFEAANTSQVKLKQIQHEALVEYIGRRRSPRPCATELISDQWLFSKPVQHRRLLESSCCQYSRCSPVQGSNISQHKLAERPWDNSSETSSGCSTRSPNHPLSKSFELQHFPKWTDACCISEKLGSTDDLQDQPEFVHFGRRARSKSFPLPQQNELAPNLNKESLRQIDNNDTPARPSTAKIKSVTEVSANWKYCDNKHVNMALNKSRFERQRGKSLDEPESSNGRPATQLSRSTDQLCCSDADGEPTEGNHAALEWKRAPLPLPELPSSKQNWIKLKRHIINSQTSQDETAIVYERSSDMTKSRSFSYSAEPVAPISPSPPSPLRKSPAWTYSHSSPSSQEDDVYFENSSVKSENSGTDLCLASEKIYVQFNLSQQHPKNMFESSSLAIAANKEIEVTEQTMSGKNSLSTVNFAQMHPTENDMERHKKDRLVDLASLPLCSESGVEMPMPVSTAGVAKSELKTENTKASLVKVHQGNRKETSQQFSTDPRNTSVQLRMKTKSPEELRMEKLMKEIIDEDHSLADVLDPNPTTKTIMDLVEGLFQNDTLVLDACQRREQLYSQTTEAETKRKDKQDIQSPSLPEPNTQPKVPNKINLRQDVSKERGECPSDVTEKKKELISTIRRKLLKLQKTKAGLHEDIKMNTLLGEDIEAWINDVCKPNEIQKYKTFIEDLDKVMNLLLCLSSRLVRVESALSKVNESTDLEEKQSLNERHQMLSRQHEGARGLKEHQDHRERVTFRILTNYLTEIQLQHCHHFVQMRKALLIKQKEVEEHLRLTEEQLGFLENSL